MERASIEEIVRSLNEAGVRYLIAGGLAVVAHGYLRLTADIDLILDLDGKNVRQAVRALGVLGYRPRAPVPLEEFADADSRSLWIREKGLTVFSLFSPAHPATEIDLFVEEPLDFDAAYASAARMEVRAGLAATFVGYDDLLRMKRAAGRPQDVEDVAQLEAIRRDARGD